jgi:ABC-type Mn2+/Zn2+ transport system ATPase subunit
METERAAPLVFEGVWAGYGTRTVLEDVGFTLRRGALTGLIGPNGSGKSTLIKVALGLLRPWRGRVQVLGMDPAEARERVGYMPQIELVDWDFPLSVAEAVLLGRYGRLRRLRPPSAADPAPGRAPQERGGRRPQPAGSTVLVATHDLHHVAHSYDDVLCLNGRVVAHGRPEVVLTEEVLQQTFGRHLVLLEIGGRTYGLPGG